MNTLRIILGVSCAISAAEAVALDYLVLKQDQQQQHVAGQVLVEAEDGGLLLKTAAGAVLAVQPDDIQNRTTDDKPLELYDRNEIIHHVLNELPQGFRVHRTANYLIFYNTTKPYAQWCGALYERLYLGFFNYWSRRDAQIRDPEQPLVALIFADKQSYTEYSRRDLADAAGGVVGYYSLESNRITTYDLTGIQELAAAGQLTGNTVRINQILSQPQAAPLVATIIHEATHQLAYNCGLQQRFVDNPLWISEGLAVFFETPDLGSRKGWKTIGATNQTRLRQFQNYLNRRPPDSLRTLLADDRRFGDPEQAVDAYAESWALCYFLLRKRPQALVAYLEDLSSKALLVYDTPEQRLETFQRHVAKDLGALDAEFLRYIRNSR